MRSAVFGAALLAAVVSAHICPFHPAIYCLEGTDASRRMNSDQCSHPLYQLPRDGWWFHGYDGCRDRPPPEGTFLELPAGGSFMVEMSGNRGKTTTAFDGKFVTPWGDGLEHPDDYTDNNCIQSPQLHTQNYDGIAGSAFAISYHSDISAVTMENLVVFTTNRRAPWKREAWYQVPKDMPACPPGGCICAWVWIPDGCGQPNMYMNAFKCKVTGATSNRSIGTPKAPVWCEDDPSKCVKGPKQIMVWHQAEGDNIEVEGFQQNGRLKSPAYNHKCGFTDGPQNDIFTGGESEEPYEPQASLPPSPPVQNPTPSAPVQNPAPSASVPKPPTQPSSAPAPPPPAPSNTPPGNLSPPPPSKPSGSTPISSVSPPIPSPSRRCKARTATDKRKRSLKKTLHHKRRAHDL